MRREHASRIRLCRYWDYITDWTWLASDYLLGGCDGLVPQPDRWNAKKHLVQMSKLRSTSGSKAVGSLEVYFHKEKSHQRDKEPSAALHYGLFPASYEQ